MDTQRHMADAIRMPSIQEYSSARRPALLFRIKCVIAAFCLAGGFSCLWIAAGMPSLISGPGVASAESSFGVPAEGTPEAEYTELRKMLLQASVDGAALGIAGILKNLPDETAKREALFRALDSLTFDMGAPVYFTAWEQTRLLHSPLTPDTENMDFADALDSRGVAFVRAQADCLKNGGGFSRVILPRQTFGNPSGKFSAATETSGSSVAAGTATLATGDVSLAASPLYAVASETTQREEEEAQIIYTRPIPNSNWHISAFMPLPEEPLHAAAPEDGKLVSVWNASFLEDKNAALAADLGLRKGLCVSGLSLLGMAGVLAAPRRREE